MVMHKDKGALPSSTLHSVQGDPDSRLLLDTTSLAFTGITTASVSPCEAACYVADMLESLENLAKRYDLNVLSLMLAMARDQADDDAGRMETESAHAAL